MVNLGREIDFFNCSLKVKIRNNALGLNAYGAY